MKGFQIQFKDEEKKKAVQKYLKMRAIEKGMNMGDCLYQLMQEIQEIEWKLKGE